MQARRDISIQQKLMRVIMVTCTVTLLLTCAAYFGYVYFNFKSAYIGQLSNTGKIIAANSTAALAFDSRDDANEILASLKADPRIIAAGLYNKEGKIFAHYPAKLSDADLPPTPLFDGYRSGYKGFEGFQVVEQDGKRLGTLYLRTDMKALYQLFTFYSLIAVLVFAFSMLVAYLLSKRLQQGITKPILSLADTSRSISKYRDYSVRAVRYSDDELGLLTDAFNQMLSQIEAQNQQIISFNQQLETRISQRTTQLEMANKELEAFSYSVSHDLRAPLRVIGGYTSLLEEEYSANMDANGKKLLVQVRRNAQKMATLIDDLLAFAHVGRKEVAKEMVDMTLLTKEVLQEVDKAIVHQAQVKIHPLHPACGDAALLQMVMTNLISNAIKYSAKKENPVVQVRSEDNGKEVVYSVSDNGAGFDMQYAHKLFGVFQRLHSSTDFAGTGIGLAIVERIITRHGGRVWAEGKPEEGATFYFTIPDKH